MIEWSPFYTLGTLQIKNPAGLPRKKIELQSVVAARKRTV